MSKTVLIVDDDRILLRLIEKKLKKYENIFSILMAEDGQQAVTKLKEYTVSLVVTDLNMPKMDGFALLAHLSANYPDIPVIILTAYSSPASKKTVLAGGAIGYIEKPFVVEDLAQKIILNLEKESEGGTLQTVPLDMFLQLVEMEQKTCTIRVFNKSSGQQGVLFFQTGELYDARILDLKGLPAAYQIFSWENISLSIQDTCPLETNQIKGNLKTILMEAMRLKDEAAKHSESVMEQPVERTDHSDLKRSKLPEPLSADSVQLKLEKMKGAENWLKEILLDDAWNGLIKAAARLGRQMAAGELQTCYINKGESTDFIIIPTKKPTVISVNSACPRDKITQMLDE